MPYRIRKRECTQEDGTKGTHVVQKEEGGVWRTVACATDKEDAEVTKAIAEREE